MFALTLLQLERPKTLQGLGFNPIVFRNGINLVAFIVSKKFWS